ncbi:MAG: hypothetical protein LBU83_03795, partial [Bacteroidales bacterium]|nr:hypothetical protein [Bacteroidales bacterium]
DFGATSFVAKIISYFNDDICLQKEDGTGIANDCFESHRIKSNNAFANTYLKSVSYGNKGKFPSCATKSNYEGDFLFNLVFDYGDHQLNDPQYEPDQPWSVRTDTFSNYKAGFEIRTYRLCKRILMFHRFTDELGTPILGNGSNVNV